MSDTPRTDKANEQYWFNPFLKGVKIITLQAVHIDFARQLERENAELHKQRQRYALLSSTAMKADHELIIKLRKDKERLDWLQSSGLTLHSWEEGDVWARAGIYTIREYIDKQMEEAQ